jgi:hypothetical protein
VATRKIDPLYLWHWATCQGCGENVYASDGELLPETVRPGCCGATPDNFGTAIDPSRAHPVVDGKANRVSCHACIRARYAPKGTEGDTMAKKKSKAPRGYGVGSKDAGNGRPLTTLGAAAKITRPERTERRRFFEFLPVRVQDSEKLAAHAELSRLEGDRLRLKSEKREVLARFRERFNGLDVEIEKLVAKGNEGTEKRRVECAVILLATNEVEVVRLDTGEIVEKRTATADELQLALPQTDAEATAGDAHEPPFGDASQATRKGRGKGKAKSESDETLEATP